jgi:hypothetical protein
MSKLFTKPAERPDVVEDPEHVTAAAGRAPILEHAAMAQEMFRP